MKRQFFLAFCFVVLWTCQGMAATFHPANELEFVADLTTAQSNGENDIIELGAGTITLANTLYYTALENYSIIIQGAGAGLTILDGGGVCSIMDITTFAPDSLAHVILRGITLQNGLTNS